jgi:PPK2 family polyphosphate:nucleotide phosphotransferase
MKKYRLKPGKKFHFKDWDPSDTGDFAGGKDQAQKELDKLKDKLIGLQKLLYAGHEHKVLIVLQGMDTSGKDSTIRFVFEGINPQGVRVAQFGVPTKAELDHDYLWRIHHQTPSKGEIAIFNRSHYEDVLAVRVHNFVPKKVWQKRYGQINDFERMLTDEGTIVLKFFLQISRAEQKKRLEERLEDPTKRWKFQPNDLKERKLWSQYMRAYADLLGKTSTDWAPWHIVPANTKWYRNWIIAKTIVDALEKLNMKYPVPKEKINEVRIR